jgi:hypothetical protein
MPGINEVNDPHVRLVGVLAMQATGVLLQRAFPRNRHRQHQCVERRMVEPFANQFARGQQDPRYIWCKPFERRQVSRTLLLRRSALQRDQVLNMRTQGRIERGEMLRALGQDQDLPSQPIGVDDFRDDAGRASVIGCQRAEDLLDARIGRNDDRRRQVAASPPGSAAHPRAWPRYAESGRIA